MSEAIRSYRRKQNAALKAYRRRQWLQKHPREAISQLLREVYLPYIKRAYSAPPLLTMLDLAGK